MRTKIKSNPQLLVQTFIEVRRVVSEMKYADGQMDIHTNGRMKEEETYLKNHVGSGVYCERSLDGLRGLIS
jgi:hypothetical protein